MILIEDKPEMSKIRQEFEKWLQREMPVLLTMKPSERLYMAYTQGGMDACDDLHNMLMEMSNESKP